MQGSPAVEWSKSRSWASDRFAVLESVHWNHPGETEVRKLILQWGAFIEASWRIPSPHAGVSVSPLLEEVRECCTKCQDSAAFGHLVRPFAAEGSQVSGTVWPPRNKVELGHEALMKGRVVATRPENWPPKASRVVLVHVSFLFPFILHSCNGGWGSASARAVPPSQLVCTCAATARDQIPSAKSLHPGPKQLWIRMIFRLASSEMRELPFAS